MAVTEREYVCLTCGSRGTVENGTFDRLPTGTLVCECESRRVRWNDPSRTYCAGCLRPIKLINGVWQTRKGSRNPKWCTDEYGSVHHRHSPPRSDIEQEEERQ